ncbi:MAG: nucleotidyltransferase domain-containing protein [Magnetococcus sp. DMHC-1]|nr:nucleotidyltransferase domain-containing protein [Magnetococcales bacterium]
MVSEQSLAEAVQRLVEVAKPVKVILFGSYATGKATEDSDLDFMVIGPSMENTLHSRVLFRDAVGDVGVGVDIIVCTEEDARRRSQVPGTIVYWAFKEGRVMYESSQR